MCRINRHVIKVLSGSVNGRTFNLYVKYVCWMMYLDNMNFFEVKFLVNLEGNSKVKRQSVISTF